MSIDWVGCVVVQVLVAQIYLGCAAAAVALPAGVGAAVRNPGSSISWGQRWCWPRLQGSLAVKAAGVCSGGEGC